PDGEIKVAKGYDPHSGLWCCDIPPIAVPVTPSRADAMSALHSIRQTFRTFPFADAPRVSSEAGELVNIGEPPSYRRVCLYRRGVVCSLSRIAPARPGNSHLSACHVGRWYR